MDMILKILKEVGLPNAYNHFARNEVPKLPYIVYLTQGSDNFAADGAVYHKIDDYMIELYTAKKEPKTELKLEKVLDKYGIFYQKTETFIASERMYEVAYSLQI